MKYPGSSITNGNGQTRKGRNDKADGEEKNATGKQRTKAATEDKDTDRSRGQAAHTRQEAMKGFAVLALAAAVALSGLETGEAACANACSGHGRCTNYAPTYSTAPANYYMPSTYGTDGYGYDKTATGKKDSCTCFLRNEDGNDVYDYTGGDCSLKTCPSGQSIGGLPYANGAHSQLTECSGVGTCDHVTGECQCEDGFTGKNCGRRTCPNDCNNNGQCMSLSDIVRNVKDLTASFAWATSTYAYDAWDASVSHGCICDQGFKGPDCSVHECPSKTDPMGGYGSESGRECSGRGKCSEDTGACRCFKGYHGAACEVQLVEAGVI